MALLGLVERLRVHSLGGCTVPHAVLEGDGAGGWTCAECRTDE